MAKSAILAAALAATSVSALNTFRHKHDRKAIPAPHPPVPHQHEARAVTYLHTETDVVTEWMTVYVTLGDEPTSATAARPTSSSSLTFVTAARPSSSSVEEAATTTTSPTSTTPKAQPTTTDLVAQKAAAPASGAQTTTSAYAKPSTTATSAAAAGSATSSSSSSSSIAKRGLAYNSASIAKTFVSTGSFSWGYDWGCTTSTESSLGVEYCPMLWGNKDNMVSLWSACAQSNIDAGATHLMSFNEPDGTTDPNNQAQMTPSEAASLHIAHMNPFSGKAKIGAPSITSDVNNTNVLTSVHWLAEFFSACNAQGGCAVDFCPVHWYGTLNQDVKTTVEDLKTFLTAASGYCNGKPLWLTEYALQGASDSETADFIAQSIPTLDSFNGLDRYSYFFVDGSLSTGGSINSLGKTYASA